MLPNFSSCVRDNEPRRKVVPKKLSQIKQTKPLQLSLFELLTETDILTEDGSRGLKKGKNYSQTIELYDFMPRFVGRTKQMCAVITTVCCLRSADSLNVAAKPIL